MFQLNPAVAAAPLAEVFAARGRVQVREFLAGDAAARLHAALRTRDDWRQVINSGDKVFDLDRATRAAMSKAQVDALDASVHAGARDGFQYRFESIRVPDGDVERGASADLLARFAEWMSQGEARDFLREVTGDPVIAFADAQATAFAPGDFLTGHDDEVAGKDRRAAYVFGLTPTWRLEWGGLLLFHGVGGGVEEGWAPGFNTINIFAVPQPHSVSLVTPSAAYRRYSVTGWLRAAPCISAIQPGSGQSATARGSPPGRKAAIAAK